MATRAAAGTGLDATIAAQTASAAIPASAAGIARIVRYHASLSANRRHVRGCSSVTPIPLPGDFVPLDLPSLGSRLVCGFVVRKEPRGMSYALQVHSLVMGVPPGIP
jgi:hypothetical protein